MSFRTTLGLALAVLATPAFAALAPEYYAAARRDAPDVIVFEVRKVATPTPLAFGTCKVSARVTVVERGTRYSVGQELVIETPCARPGAPIPAGGTVWQDLSALRFSTHGRAFLKAEGGLALDQYDILDLR